MSMTSYHFTKISDAISMPQGDHANIIDSHIDYILEAHKGSDYIEAMNWRASKLREYVNNNLTSKFKTRDYARQLVREWKTLCNDRLFAQIEALDKFEKRVQASVQAKITETVTSVLAQLPRGDFDKFQAKPLKSVQAKIAETVTSVLTQLPREEAESRSISFQIDGEDYVLRGSRSIRIPNEDEDADFER